MPAYLETDFPIDKLTPLAQREANAKRPIAMLHKWWARRLGCVFRTIILASLIPADEWRALNEELKSAQIDAWTALYYREHPKANALIDKYLKDKIVLDPFMGGGTTIVEALRLGCKVIGIDVDPVAWFVAKKSIEPINLQKLDAAFQQLKETVASEILKYYRTPCPHGDHQADVMYILWVKAVQCASCGKKTRLFNSFRIARRNGVDTVVCPKCYNVWTPKKKNGKGNNGRRVTCPDCGNHFATDGGYSSGGQFVCEHCGHNDKIVDWVRRTKRAPDHEMFAIEYYCPTDKVRGYKSVQDTDRKLYLKAVKELDREKIHLPLPVADVYDGMKTAELLNHGFTTFADLFNPRQLLCLGRLMKAITEIEDVGARELLTLTLSNSTTGNCLLARYRLDGRLVPHFSLHAYWIPDELAENNVWGLGVGASTFRAYWDITRRAIQWNVSPSELTTNGNVTVGDSPFSDIATGVSEILENKSRAWLGNRSSEDMSFIPSKSVDAVISDPPYYGNVQYAELADFFYVWLRPALARHYPQFNSPLVPKSPEIVVNEKADKDDIHFRQGLLRVFLECHSVLKDTGLLAFTFHHEKAQAWGAVLEAVLEAKFHIESVWTYHSESTESLHRGGIRFDTIIVCRKRLADPEPAAWGALKDEIVAEVKKELQRLLGNGNALAIEDVFVVTMGKAISTYSRHYPKVTQSGAPITLTQAIDGIEELVDEQIDAYFGMVVPAWLDVAARVYMQNLARREVVTRDSLVKTCRTRGIDFSDLERAHYIQRGKKAGTYRVLSPAERREWIDEQLENGGALSPIDRAHYLFTVYKIGASLRSEIPRVYQKGLDEICRALYQITRDKAYEMAANEVRRMEEAGARLV